MRTGAGPDSDEREAGVSSRCRCVSPAELLPAYRTLIQTLFSCVSSRITEKPISRP